MEGRDSFISMSRSPFTGALIASSMDRLIRLYDPRSSGDFHFDQLPQSKYVSRLRYSLHEELFTKKKKSKKKLKKSEKIFKKSEKIFKKSEKNPKKIRKIPKNLRIFF